MKTALWRVGTLPPAFLDCKPLSPLPKTMQITASLRRNSLHLVLGTLISRSSGLLRELYTASCFGADPAIAAFFIAFRLTNFFRHFVAESSLAAGFIPHFETLRTQSESQAIRFFFDLVATLLMGAAALCGLSIALFLWFHADQTNPLQESSILTMTLTMVPSLGALALYALFMAFLNCFQRYFLSALAPIPFNFLFIATLYATRTLPREEAAYLLCVAVLVGYFLQCAVLIPSVYTHVASYLTRGFLKEVRCVSHPVRLLIGSWSLTLLGVGAVQVNGLCDMAIARYVSLEGPAYLTYAIRITQAPLALFGLAITAALMPPLARAIAAARHEESSHLLSVALASTLTLLIPCSLWLTLHAEALIQLLFGHQQTSFAIQETAACLSAYALGLIPSGCVVLLAGAFYAKKNYLIPTVASLFSIALNLLGNFFFVFTLELGTVSIALATSLAACGNGLFLFYALKKAPSPHLSVKELLPPLFVVITASCIAGGVTTYIDTLPLLLPSVLPFVLQSLIALGISFLCFSLSFALIVYALGFKHLLRLEKRKIADFTPLASFEGLS